MIFTAEQRAQLLRDTSRPERARPVRQAPPRGRVVIGHGDGRPVEPLEKSGGTRTEMFLVFYKDLEIYCGDPLGGEVRSYRDSFNQLVIETSSMRAKKYTLEEAVKICSEFPGLVWCPAESRA